MDIRVESLTKSFGRVTALDDVTLDAPAGAITVLLGANGAGKTTLLRCLAGVCLPDRGRILYDGEPFERSRLDIRRRFMFLPDTPLLIDAMTPLQHLALVLQVYDARRPGVEEEAIDLLRALDVLCCVEMPVEFLSRGQRYKVALVGLLLVDPDVWLLDEPIASGMDPQGILLLKDKARDAAARGRVVFYSTQMAETAERFSDRHALLHKGRVRAVGRTAELRGSGSGDLSAIEEILDSLRGAQK